MKSMTHPSSDHVAHAGQLLRQANIAGPFELVPLAGGANSKAFRIELDGGEVPLFFKAYFHHPDDPRDRLGTEFAFASFVWERGLRAIAEPLAMNRDTHCALYSFLDGRKIGPHEVTHEAVEQCLRFFEAIHACKASASHLPAASEACFTLADHWQCLRRRVQRLASVTSANSVDRQAHEFIRTELESACSKQLQAAEDLAGRLKIAPDAPISQMDRCISPSDFGFHNALHHEDGVLRFLDFEYAGWDDPAKTVCDFFCQPACPAPVQYYADFADRIAGATYDPTQSRKRFDLLLPIYRLKWCCIMLNDFLPAGGSRRRFAMHGSDENTRKSQQLQKARAALERYRNSSPVELAA
jgi:hypothetical protein